ncbi:MAG: hypothetical protein K6G18_06150 [Treponema sp.]|nr:hypothetical protein [Treponema sp.]
MATLTTCDIKTIDELAEISKDELSNEDSLLTFDKDMNCHKKFKVTALRAFVNENAHDAAAQAAAAAASASDAASSATAAAGSATSAASSATSADGNATLAESWAVGHTGTRTGEDTDNAKYYAETAASAATSATASESAASASATGAETAAESAAGSAADASDSADAAAESARIARESEPGQAVDAARTYATQAESWAVGGTGTRLGEDTDNAMYYARLVAGRGTVPADVSIDAMVGEAYAGTWLLPSTHSVTGEHKPTINGSALAVDTLLTVRTSEGVTHQELSPKDNPGNWTSRRAYRNNAWINVNTNGGWTTQYPEYRGVVPTGISIDDMIGPEWVGTWFFWGYGYTGHKPYVAGAITQENGTLFVRYSHTPSNSGGESFTIQTITPTGNNWRADRTYYHKSGWLNASDTPVVGTSYGGWVVDYLSGFIINGSSFPYANNGIHVRYSIYHGIPVVEMYGNDKDFYYRTNYLIASRAEMEKYWWYFSLRNTFVWFEYKYAIYNSGNAFHTVVLHENFGDGYVYMILESVGTAPTQVAYAVNTFPLVRIAASS